ncbi:MAG: hypothetical protein N3D11_15835 [Candidatus Sumerlaeia bacterium]|nr:hypothetical protein [Candidatus Sumerlaeia bacterium]
MMATQISKTVIPKQMIQVILRTTEHRIEGVMHVLYNHRVLDVLNGVPELFVPITSARIYTATGETLLAERDFIAVNKNHIMFLYEVGEQSTMPASRHE